LFNTVVRSYRSLRSGAIYRDAFGVEYSPSDSDAPAQIRRLVEWLEGDFEQTKKGKAVHKTVEETSAKHRTFNNELLCAINKVRENRKKSREAVRRKSQSRMKQMPPTLSKTPIKR
jgi:hypothetical protein